MLKISQKFLLVILALFITASAHAAVFVSATFAAPPDSGQYWNPQEPGNGYGIDIDSNGSVFVQWFTYRGDGVPVWYTMSGKIERAAAQTIRFTQVPACTNVRFGENCLGDKIRFLKTGVLARVTSPVYAVVNGACPTCPPRFPDVSQSPLGPATIEWVGSRAAVLTFQGRSVSIQRQDIATPISTLVANINFKGVLAARITIGANLADQFWPFTARFSKATLITSVTSSTVNGKPAFDLSSLNLNLATTQLFLGNIVHNAGVIFNDTDKVIAVDEKNNRAYLLLGRTRPASFEFEVSSYGELFIYGDRLISWPRDPFTQESQALGFPSANFDWKFERTTSSTIDWLSF